MTETLVVVEPPSQEPEQRPPSAAELDAARELVQLARERGVALTGPDGLLKALTKTVIEIALDEEMSEHLGYDKHDPAGRNRGNSRNGKRTKKVLSDAAGPVQIDVPRDRDGTLTRVPSWGRVPGLGAGGRQGHRVVHGRSVNPRRPFPVGPIHAGRSCAMIQAMGRRALTLKASTISWTVVSRSSLPVLATRS